MKRLIYLICLVALSLNLTAEVTLELSRSTISMDDTVVLNLTSETRGMFRAPDIPLPEGLEVRGTSQETSVIQGQAQFTLAYTIVPTKPGTYQIGPYRLQSGETLPAQTLTVTPATAVRSSETLFATLELSSEETLIRQTVELTLTFFSQEPIGDINLLDFPQGGFELTEWQEIRSGPRQIKGERYQQKRYVARLTPTQPGILTFDPTFRVAVHDRSAPRNLLFGPSRVRTERIQLQEPIRLTVTAPPEEGRPEDYAGHIGSFRLNAEVSPTEVEAGDPITLRITLEGSGSLKQALPPHYQASPDLKVYQPRIITEDLRRDGMGGRKVLEQVVIPSSSDLTELPVLEFHYFHPDSRRYRTLTAGPFPIDVRGESVNPLTADSLALENQIAESETLGEDLIYIKLSPGRWVTLEKLTPSIGLAVSTGTPFLLWALCAVWLNKRAQFQQDPKKKNRGQASKRLRKRLSGLETTEDLWAEIWEVLSGYLRDRFTLPAGEMERKDILSALPDGVSESTRLELEKWIRACEQARFSGGFQDAVSESSEAFSAEGRGTTEEFRAFMVNLDQEIES